jgi:hypothetical protein
MADLSSSSAASADASAESGVAQQKSPADFLKMVLGRYAAFLAPFELFADRAVFDPLFFACRAQPFPRYRLPAPSS